MTKPPRSGNRGNVQNTPAVRASISFPLSLYESLEQIARRKKVSLAWVVRDAAERYVGAELKAGSGVRP
jgi:hypothetical protein